MVNVGWIGLGAMGAPMAGVLARAGHHVAAYDVNAAAATALTGDGVVAAQTVADATREADVLAIMVATASQAEEVPFGEGGAAAVLREGAVVLVMSTVGPKPESVESLTCWPGFAGRGKGRQRGRTVSLVCPAFPRCVLR